MHISTTAPRALFVLMGLSLMVYGACSYAHHPHDPVNMLAVSPTYSEDNIVYIANSKHLFKSADGGQSWKELVNGLDHIYPISSIGITPSETGSQIIFISTLGNGVYRSTDAGASWKNASIGLKNLAIYEISVRYNNIVLANDAKGQLYFTNDSGESWRTATMPQDAVITAVSPPIQFPETKILAGDSLGRILVSTDNGSHWETIGQLPTKAEITVIAIDPSDGSRTTFFVGTQNKGLYKSLNNGKSFQSLGNGLAAHHIMSLAFSPDFAQDRTMIATSWHEAIFISSDGGDTWIKHSKGLTTNKQADEIKYRSPHFRQVTITNNDSQTMFLAAFTGLYKSTNGGHSWSEMETQPVKLIKGLAASPALKSPFSIGITTYGGGAYVSHDNGMSWVIANKGLKTTRLSDIKFAPSSSKDSTLFSGSIGFLLKSTDNGVSWNAMPLYNDTLRNKIGYKLLKFGLSKNIAEKLGVMPDMRLVYPTVITPSPNYAIDKTLLFGTRWHGMYRSEDGGQTSENIWDGTTGAITSLAISPDFSKDHMAFIYIRDDGIYKSTDKGDSWRRLVQGLPFDIINPANSNKHLKHDDFAIIFSPGYSKDQTLFAGGGLGLFKSIDKGENWSELKNSPLETTSSILAMGLSPNYVNDRTLLISLKGHGLYKSVDGGQTFFEMGKTLIKNNHSIELIEFSSDFSQNDTIYAASNEDLFQSSDRGNSWTLIQRPVRYEDYRNIIHYEGNWVQTESSQYSASTIHYSETKGNKATLAFVGCGIRWIARKSPESGTANVYIDNLLIDSVDLYSKQLEPMTDVFSRTGLRCNPHTITIEVSEGKTGNLSAGQVAIDAFDVLPAN